MTSRGLRPRQIVYFKNICCDLSYVTGLTVEGRSKDM